MEFLVDRTSIEAFANDGEVSSTRYVLPKGNGLSVKAEGGPARSNRSKSIRSIRRGRMKSRTNKFDAA